MTAPLIGKVSTNRVKLSGAEPNKIALPTLKPMY
jgi:hypothetical protein